MTHDKVPLEPDRGKQNVVAAEYGTGQLLATELECIVRFRSVV